MKRRSPQDPPPPSTPAAKTGGEERLAMGRTRDEARFTAPPPAGKLPANYGETLATLKELVRQARLKTILAANAALVLAYWEMGRTILLRQAVAGWGAKVIDRLSADLRREFPDMQGLSPRNLKYMRAFAAAWPDPAIVQGPLAQITWYHNIALLEKLDDPGERLWYAQQVAGQGWSQPVLCLQIERQVYQRQGRAVTNFPATLPPAESDLAAQVFKDPYLFDFLGTADPRREREVEQTLVDHIQHFLLELGAGFAFAGRQVHLEIGGHDFYLDLLFYHLRLRRYVVVELKAVPFDPAFAGTMNLYLSAVDDLLRHPDDQPAIGLLLCRGKDRLVVEYALRGLSQPLGVADWETALVRALPGDLQASLPTVEEIEQELATASTPPPARRKKKDRRS